MQFAIVYVSCVLRRNEESMLPESAPWSDADDALAPSDRQPWLHEPIEHLEGIPAQYEKG